jgi:predicted permease
MNLFAFLRSHASSLFQKPQINGEMDEELRSHIQHRADDLERSGLDRAEAERRARIEFGGYERYKQESHEAVGGQFFETLTQDIRYGFRMLRKNPGFTAVAVLTLAFGIGANTVVFSVLNALILRPLNVPQSQSLFMIERVQEGLPMQSYPDYVDLRDRTRSFDGVAAYDMAPAGFDANGKPSPVWLYETSGNYFDILNIQPYLGRFFHRSDEHGPNGSPYIVLSYGFWQSRFQGDHGVVGRMVRVNQHPFNILGVSPPHISGTEQYFSPDFWVPIMNTEQVQGWDSLQARSSQGISLVGHLKPGVTLAQASGDLGTVAAYLDKTYPKEDGKISFALSRPGLVGNMLGRPVRAFISGLMLLAGLILLAACANLGSLFAARAADRAREIALRLALGSSRKRILRQLLTEAVLVSLIGGVAGLLGGIGLLHWLSAWQPVPNMPINLPVNPNASVYAIALLLALASGLIFGMVPVRQVLRSDPWQVVKSGSLSAIGRRYTMRDLLLVIQIVVCAVLVTSSLVAVRGLVRSLHSNFGFLPQSAMLVETDLDMGGYAGDRVAPMQRRMLDEAKTIPGVTAVGLSDRLPLGLGWNSTSIFTDNATDLSMPNAVTQAITYNISPEYFAAAGTTMLAGRSFTWHDDAHSPLVAVVNREFAHKTFGSEKDAVGRYYKKMDGTRIQVVGLVEDGKYKTLTEDPQPAAFSPILQSPTSSTFLVIRSDRDPHQLLMAIDDKLHALDPGLPFTVKTWNTELNSALFASRVATISLGVLGGLGAMLAITGIFGMASYSVSKRLRELGIRIALGAQRGEVLQTALGKAWRLLAFGSVVGLLLGLATTKVLSFIVYQASPRDPLVLFGVVLAMLLLGLLATWIPAQRALAADPLVLLREE